MTDEHLDRIRGITKSLMVVHGAGMGILISLLGAAMDHPALFGFITTPLIFLGLGFLLALLAHNTAVFDPPPGGLVPTLVLSFPMWLSGLFVLVAVLNGAAGYFSLVSASGFRPTP